MRTLRSIDKKLEADGWAIISTAASTQEGAVAELKSLASTLGDIVPGRGGRIVEPILPEPVERARAGSLSSKFGLLPLPLHTDTAHWNVPCRYLLLACVNPGPVPTPTFLLDAGRLSSRRAKAWLVGRLRLPSETADSRFTGR
jgi:hypothetical protein